MVDIAFRVPRSRSTVSGHWTIENRASSRAMGAAGTADFEEVFGRLFDRAYRVAYRILGDAQDAEDAAAEAFARAHARWSKVGELPYCDAWILRVASNVAIDVARRRRRTLVGDVASVA